jgi:hypothetical protein
VARRAGRQWFLLSVASAVLFLWCSLASAVEVRLAGIRLDAPWPDVVDVYGQPDAVALYQRRQAGADGGAGGNPPMWGVPVWSVLDKGEAQCFYWKGQMAVGFVFDIEGCVRMIAVAGDAAGMPTWRPHRYVKLGDTWKRILYHYGLPDKLQRFGGAPAAEADAVPAGAPGAPPIDAEQIAVGDWLFTYSEDSNIAFVTHNGQVARIHIWKPAD